MSLMRELYTVVDIGTQEVRVLIGQPEVGGKVSILGLGIQPAQGIDERGVANVERLVECLQKALRQASQQSNVAVQRVWVSLNHMDLHMEWTQAIITFPQADHEISWADLERLRQQAIQRPAPPEMELIHAIPQAYRLDHRRNLRDPIGMTGMRLEGDFCLLYAPKPHLAMLRKCFQRLGLEVEGFVAKALMEAEVYLTPEQKSSGVALLHLGAHATTIILYADGILKHFAVLPLGGHLITTDLREALRVILIPQAERLKREQGVALAAKVAENDILRLRIPGYAEPINVKRRFLAEVIEARLQEILLFVAREIEKAGLLRRLYGGVHLAGGGALLAEIEAVVEYVLGERAMKVDVAPILGRGLTESVQNPRLAGAVATLYAVPKLHEFMPPLPTTNAPEKKPPIERGRFFQKIRTFIETNFKIPQDLIN